MTVNQIVTLYNQGHSAEQIVEQYPHRTLSEIFTVLAWYHANKAAFDKELSDEGVAEERTRQEIEQAEHS